MRAWLSIVLLSTVTWMSAQETVDLPSYGWYDLPDSLFRRWKLDEDQVKRIRVIEEDYDTERSKLMADMRWSVVQRDARLRDMAAKRRDEVGHVINAEQFEEWKRLSKAR